GKTGAAAPQGQLCGPQGAGKQAGFQAQDLPFGGLGHTAGPARGTVPDLFCLLLGLSRAAALFKNQTKKDGRSRPFLFFSSASCQRTPVRGGSPPSARRTGRGSGS